MALPRNLRTKHDHEYGSELGKALVRARSRTHDASEIPWSKRLAIITHLNAALYLLDVPDEAWQQVPVDVTGIRP